MSLYAKHRVQEAGNMSGQGLRRIPLEKCRIAGFKWGNKLAARRARRSLEEGIIQEELDQEEEV
jgi:hypothetical protein